MAKKYLGIDEAAEILGITKEELNRLRQKGEIRGFGDRGTFKFIEEDVNELARRRQPSSDPDVPMIDGDDDASVLDEDSAADGSDLDGAPSIIRRLSGGATSSDADSGDAVGSIFDDLGAGGVSDSDVRLVMDDRLDAGHDGGQDVLMQMQDSDSDVRLDNDSAARLAKPDSDSDVMLVSEEPDSDSDVHLAAEEDDEVDFGLQSDSDVRLVAADSDSDVRLLDDARLAGPRSKIKKDSDSDVAVLPDSSLDLEIPGSGQKSGIYGEGSSILLDDSNIALNQGSGFSLTSQSGVVLDRVTDSGVSLEKKAADDDSSLAMFSDEDEGGITLESDSGIALSSDDEDEGGITLAEIPVDSGISLKDDDDDLQLTATMPAMKTPKGKKKPADDDDTNDTMFEVPSVSADDGEAESDFEIGAVDGGSQSDTSVLLFDDEDETDDGGAAMVKKKASDEDGEDEPFELYEEESPEEVENVFAGDEAFEEESEFESEEELEPATKAVAGGAIEYPWGAGVVTSLAVSSIVMIFCGMASIDLVRSMWGHQGYSSSNGWLIETLGGLFK